ncbi:MAG: type II secretion system F family protein [Bryobacteraceae bacterium]
MLGIILIVFFAVFLIVMLPLFAGSSEDRKQKQLAVTRLDSLITGAPTGGGDDLLDIRKHEVLSTIPWLNRLLTEIDFFPRLRMLLYQADLNWNVGRLLLMSVACLVFVAYVIYWRTDALPLALGVGLVAGAGPFVYVLSIRAKRFSAFERLLPEALDMMVGALRAGHSLTSTIGMVGREMAQPISREFRKCFDEQMYGIETRAAMLNLVTRVPIQPVRIIATAIMIQKESGGNLAEVLEKAAYVIRERFQLRRQINVHTAQGRMTGWILALLPVVLGFMLYLLNPESFSLLWKRPMGLRMLYGATVMTIIGSLIIRKIVRIRI